MGAAHRSVIVYSKCSSYALLQIAYPCRRCKHVDSCKQQLRACTCLQTECMQHKQHLPVSAIHHLALSCAAGTTRPQQHMQCSISGAKSAKFQPKLLKLFKVSCATPYMHSCASMQARDVEAAQAQLCHHLEQWCMLQTLQAVGCERDSTVRQLSGQVGTGLCCSCVWSVMLDFETVKSHHIMPYVRFWSNWDIPHQARAQKNTSKTWPIMFLCVIRESNPGLYRGRVLFYH